MQKHQQINTNSPLAVTQTHTHRVRVRESREWWRPRGSFHLVAAGGAAPLLFWLDPGPGHWVGKCLFKNCICIHKLSNIFKGKGWWVQEYKKEKNSRLQSDLVTQLYYFPPRLSIPCLFCPFVWHLKLSESSTKKSTNWSKVNFVCLGVFSLQKTGLVN